MQDFGAFIKSKREARNWTLRVAAQHVEISASRLAEIERGVSYHTERPTRPTPDLVERIARAYDVPIDYALAEAGYSPHDGARLAPDAERLVSLFESLDPEHRDLALDFLRLLLEHDGRSGSPSAGGT